MKEINTTDKSSKNTHKDHRSRRKTSYLAGGFESFSDVEKLEFILFYAINQKDTNPIAHRLLDTFGSFKNVIEAPIEALTSVKGLGQHSAILINLIYQSMLAYSASHNLTSIKNVTDAKKVVSGCLFGNTKEELVLICLSESNKILMTKKLTSESPVKVDVSLSTIILTALNCRATKIIIGHNHPNGMPYPSDDDLKFTSNLFLNLLMNDVVLVDHIITSPNGSFSFLHNKLIDCIKEDALLKLKGNNKALNLLKQPQSSYVDNEID